MSEAALGFNNIQNFIVFAYCLRDLGQILVCFRAHVLIKGAESDRISPNQPIRSVLGQTDQTLTLRSPFLTGDQLGWVDQPRVGLKADPPSFLAYQHKRGKNREEEEERRRRSIHCLLFLRFCCSLLLLLSPFHFPPTCKAAKDEKERSL